MAEEKSKNAKATAEMKTAIIFLVVFTICVIFGQVVQNWWDWLAGLCFGVSAIKVAPLITKYVERHT